MRKNIMVDTGFLKVAPMLIIIGCTLIIGFFIYFGLKSENTKVIEKEVLIEKEVDPYVFKGNEYVIEKSEEDDDYIILKITGKRCHYIALYLMDDAVKQIDYSRWHVNFYVNDLDENEVSIEFEKKDAYNVFEYLRKNKL